VAAVLQGHYFHDTPMKVSQLAFWWWPFPVWSWF